MWNPNQPRRSTTGCTIIVFDDKSSRYWGESVRSVGADDNSKSITLTRLGNRVLDGVHGSILTGSGFSVTNAIEENMP